MRIINGTLIVIALLWIISIGCVLGFSAYDGAAAPAISLTDTTAALAPNRPPDQSPIAIIVLGAAQYDGRPSPVLRARLDHALQLWRQDTTRILVFTGGMGMGDTTSEALVSRTYARRHGVPDDAILLEGHGRTTHESMRAVAELLRARDLRQVVLVSDPFHMFRLWIVAHRLGLHATTSPTRTSPIAASGSKNWTYILSESFKAPAALLID